MSQFEAAYYEYDGFWSPHSNTLGRADQERVEHVIALIPGNARSLLDVGCGNGIFANAIAKRRPTLRVVGTDRSAAALQHVQVESQRADIATLPFADASFDVAVSLEVIEHLPIATFRAALGELARVAAETIIVSVPFDQRLGEGQTQCPACRTSFDPDLHLRSFTEPTMRALLAAEGWRCTHVETYGTVGLPVLPRVHSLINSPLRPETMQAPICPLCGFENGDYAPGARSRSRLARMIESAIHLTWPKRSASRWILGIYSKVSA